ncbi:MAG TPA: UDP-N-acetylmuramoyl-L-alanyl-D-glutamate--2,6-diaminopimelate ligase [Exilispira sp.]|nr:UDP-N-acetylmuramoyl-L-alanyl-D-glutamate--2,6-diaminopimelate ligase [Exilispira sp.]
MEKIRLLELINILRNYKINFEVYDPLNLAPKLIIEDIFSDTREVEKSSKNPENSILFIAIKGEKFDGHSKIFQIAPRCKVILIENIEFLENKIDLNSFCINNNIVVIKSNNNRLMMAYLYKIRYDNIDEKLNIFAITGTDGKTSMVTILHLLFSNLFSLSASIGTLGVNVNGNKIEFNQTTPTTPEIKDIYNIFNQLYQKGVKTIFMEATSIASVQKRVASISFDSLSFTTMTSDHLDFHKSLENYYEAKLAFIDQLANSKKDVKSLLFNLDDANSELVIRRLKRYKDIFSLSFGYNELSDFKIIKTEYIDRLLNIKIEISERLTKLYNIPEAKKIIEIKTNLIGRVNSYNIAHSVAQIFDYLIIHQKQNINQFFYSIEKAKDLFTQLIIPGRMERIEFKNNDIFIDYAHTADSLKNAILTLKEAGYKKVITVMGCGGDRDKTKRPEMGRISTELSDIVIVTSDNPRSEEPEQIIEDIIEGIKKDNYFVEIDRKKAIEKAFDLLKTEKGNTALLIAGKGHEDYQEIKGIKYHFSDKEVVENLIY